MIPVQHHSLSIGKLEVKTIMPPKTFISNSKAFLSVILIYVCFFAGFSSSRADQLKIVYDNYNIEKKRELFKLFDLSQALANSKSGPNLIGQMKSFKLSTIASPRPNLNWKDANEQKITLENFSGKVVLLNFWASWCLPCIRELPSINRLQGKFGGDKFTVVALNIDRGGKAVASRFKRKLKLSNLALHLDQKNEVAKLLKIKVLPTTIVFDSKGREVGKMEAAAEWDVKEAFALIEYFINNPGHAERLSFKRVFKDSQTTAKGSPKAHKLASHYFFDAIVSR